ncbi:MAG: glycogen(starch) synthase [Verrucomicrobiales bacterium]|jgi:glycogen(starch) synthase
MKVLMLGWEFPPIINGGLGIACLGMGKALAKHVDLSFILPKVDPNFVVDGVSLTGLDHLPLSQARQITEEMESPSEANIETFATVDRIEADLLPYTDGNAAAMESIAQETARRREVAMQSSSAATLPPTRTAAAQIRYGTDSIEPFKAGDLYSDDVFEKVTAFAKAAAIISDTRDFDIIHVHDWMTFPAGVAIKERTGKSLVLHVHSLSYDRAGPDSRGWIFDIEKSGMEAADLIIPVSEYTGNIVTGHYGIDPAKVVPIHNGAESVAPYRTEKAFPEKLVLFLGRLTAQKGPEFFLEIAAKVLKENRNVRFVMAGTGEKLRALIEYGAYHDVGDRFHFTGFLNKQKVNELLSMTDVYCMPSVSEPFGLSALEAAQYGIPAVISKQSGVAEVLTRSLQADYWDIDLMAKHIVTLLNDDDEYQRVVDASLEDQRNCTWEVAAERIVEAYETRLGIDVPL